MLNKLSIRTALFGAIVISMAVVSAVVGIVGVMTIGHTVTNEAQQRVNHDLETVKRRYDERLSQLAGRMTEAAALLDLTDPGLSRRLAALRESMRLSVLNVCGVDGTPLAGTHAPEVQQVPVKQDPVLRRALEGVTTAGTVRLTADRLLLEGGRALVNALAVLQADKKGVVEDALVWWVAVPIEDAEGRIIALAYGGRGLSMHFELVDELQDLAFGTRVYNGKPLGTVTIFMGDLRVATNVLQDDGKRAVGTRVSTDVQRQVLQQGGTWNDRAWVVDSWYLSAYEPLRNPDGDIIGMLYVGLLEAPYADLLSGMTVGLILIILVGAALALVLAGFLVRYITKPLRRLSKAVDEVAAGDREQRLEQLATYTEIAGLSRGFRLMQEAIAVRDRRLSERNEELAQTNEQLAKVNRNYMETLGFVTHELKSPLASIQSMIDAVIRGFGDEVPGAAADFLQRIRRACGGLQDMVKDYLDLSRAERGELQPAFRMIEFCKQVVEPCVQNTLPLFAQRSIRVERQCPDSLTITADPELLGIALSNLLSNAAKYGEKNGEARLEVEVLAGRVHISVWNRGHGFTPEEGERLFHRFSRLDNPASKGRRGSGLGLFITRRITEVHGGTITAESEPGAWARFTIDIPTGPVE